MRKILTFLIIFGGTVSCVLMFSIVLYAITPEYRQVVTALVEDDDIPVVTVSQQPIEEEVKESEEPEAAPEKKPDSVRRERACTRAVQNKLFEEQYRIKNNLLGWI